MRPLVLVTALFLSAEAMPAAAQTPAPAQVRAPDPARPVDADKMVCKEQPIEGTRFMKRICLTRAAWADREKQRQAAEGPPGHSSPQGPMLYAPSAFGRGVPMQ